MKTGRICTFLLSWLLIVCGLRVTALATNAEDNCPASGDGHEYNEWIVISEMTPFAKGLRERTCIKCGFKQLEEMIPAGIIQRDDYGEGVKKLQEALNAAGYDCGTADGEFGGKTEAAIKKLEEELGLEQDGIAWPGLHRHLYMVTSMTKSSAISLSVTPTTGDGPYYENDMMGFDLTFVNSSGQNLKEWTIFQQTGEEKPDEGWAGIPGGEAAASGETVTWHVDHLMTKEEADAGSLTLRWYATAALADGETVWSDNVEITVSVGMKESQGTEAGSEASAETETETKTEETQTEEVQTEEMQTEEAQTETEQTGTVSRISLSMNQTSFLKPEGDVPDITGLLGTATYEGTITNTGDRDVSVSSILVYMYPHTESAVTADGFDPVILKSGDTHPINVILKVSTGNITPGKNEVLAEFIVSGKDPKTGRQTCVSNLESFSFVFDKMNAAGDGENIIIEETGEATAQGSASSPFTTLPGKSWKSVRNDSDVRSK